jgi:hypothetical protein
MASRALFALFIATVALRGIAASPAEIKYLNNDELERELRALARAHRDLVRIETLGRTPQKEEVRLIELGAGRPEERKSRPGLLVAAGIEGNDLAGTASALHWMQQLTASVATNEQTKGLLATTTIYVLPRLNPDAAKSYFESPRVETAASPAPKVDDDHDGFSDEDGPEDLNKDGLITWMRVEDPEGEYVLDRSDQRLLIRADRAKGEKGQWRLLVEGRDNDQDENWNEDGPGGVNYNRNFPYNYRFFAAWAGIHQVSETVTRALADFIVEHPNIAVVFTFGSADNLTQPPKAEAPKRPPTAVHEDDLPFYRELGKSWREALSLKKELGGASEPGTFSDWMYFHRGRLSLAARPWSPAVQLELAKGKTAKDEKEDDKKPEAKPEEKASGRANRPGESPEAKKDTKPEPDSRNEEERKFLKWLDEHAADSFVPWQKFEHPDFPGKNVEIGGLAPFAKSNPPEKLLPTFAASHAKFLNELAGKLPKIQFRKVTIKHLGDSVFEVTVQVENTGYLPTSLAQGEMTREVAPTRVVLGADRKEILSGMPTTNLAPIQGSGGMRELRYIVFAKDRQELNVKVISTLAGTVSTNVALGRNP